MKRTPAATAPPPHEAGGHQTLSAYIQARFDDFSRSQKDVAQYIVDHLDEVAFQTAEELARRANTSSSTVVRFSQALNADAEVNGDTPVARMGAIRVVPTPEIAQENVVKESSGATLR